MRKSPLRAKLGFLAAHKFINVTAILVLALSMSFLVGCKSHIIGMLDPKGLITFEERKLFFDTLALMLIVVLPVIIMSLTFVYHYQVSHQVTDYKPNWAHDYFLESLWWGIPCAIIVILAILTWKKTHELDPYRAIAGHNPQPYLIQVVALPWKWMFIYPQDGIATINYLVVPVGKQVEYWMTADNVPMSAFFIPQIGSQIYVMAGMRTRLHLVANYTGQFDGLNTQYNGNGFSDMHFPVHVVEDNKLQSWIGQVKAQGRQLTPQIYQQLLLPSVNDAPQVFSGVNKSFFDHIVNLYMHSHGPNHPRHDQAAFHSKQHF